MKPHWDSVNPWRAQLVYVPIEELAECVMHQDKESALANWRQGGDKLDAYILTNGDSIGIRYGAKGHEYISPYGNESKVRALLEKYRGVS